MKNIFIVVLNLAMGSVQPIFRIDDDLMVFETEEAANAEIKDCIEETTEAFERGDMDEPYSPDDYSVLPATLEGDRITCVYDGTKYTMLRSDEDWKEVNWWGFHYPKPEAIPVLTKMKHYVRCNWNA